MVKNNTNTADSVILTDLQDDVTTNTTNIATNTTDIADLTDSGSGTFTFSVHPWAAAPTISYSYKVSGNIISMTMTGTAANTTNSFTATSDVFIPAAYRPSATQYFIISAPINNVQSLVRADVYSTGLIDYHPWNANNYTTGQVNTGFYAHTISWNF